MMVQPFKRGLNRKKKNCGVKYEKKKQTVNSKKGCQIAKGKKKSCRQKNGVSNSKKPKKKLKKKKKQTRVFFFFVRLLPSRGLLLRALSGSSSSLVAAVRACCRGWCRGGWVVSRLQVGCWVVSELVTAVRSCVRLGKL
ncbi:hypothetical protein GYH30_024227 [Glycine max]|uniref:Uncharacterized protein n=1 Tax=Glycine max TaxID=3847 RepID=A0A0R0I4M8_SOYBN|nr:hypothetical protein GYH30_024227 [Glycine max]